MQSGKAAFEFCLKDGHGPLSMMEGEGRPERHNNMNKGKNAIDQWFLKYDLKTSSIKIT